jgi:hypothetical protein
MAHSCPAKESFDCGYPGEFTFGVTSFIGLFISAGLNLKYRPNTTLSLA